MQNHNKNIIKNKFIYKIILTLGNIPMRNSIIRRIFFKKNRKTDDRDDGGKKIEIFIFYEYT
jgi:hypothetical protein